MVSDSRLLKLLLLAGLAIWPLLLVFGQGKPAVKRVKLPDFKNESRLKTIFFDKALEKLAGQRQINSIPAANNPGGNSPAEEPGAAGGTGKWAELISPTTIEDEIKAIKLAVDKDVDKPSQFAGGGYQNARYQFSVVTSLFGIIAEYDGDVRWKSQSVGVRDVFARTAANCKVGSTQAFNEAKLRKADLQDLLGGATITAQARAEDFSWDRIVDRAPLMQRLEVAVDDRLSPMTSNAAEFQENAEIILHEAEIVAAMAHVFTRPGMEDGDDEDYAGYTTQMKTAAREVVDAVKLKDADRASSAVGAMSQACTQCHELYRS